MAVSEEKRQQQAAFDMQVDALRRRMTQRQIAAKLKCSPTKVRCALERLGSVGAVKHESAGNHVVTGGIVHHCACGWRSRPWFSNLMASADGQRHREEMEKLAHG